MYPRNGPKQASCSLLYHNCSISDGSIIHPWLSGRFSFAVSELNQVWH